MAFAVGEARDAVLVAGDDGGGDAALAPEVAFHVEDGFEFDDFRVKAGEYL